MFDDALLEDYMHNFYGYGNTDSDLWFIGMEEGGIDSVAEMPLRMAVWKNRGSRVLEDLIDYHHAVGTIGISRFLGTKPALQPTWKQLIRVLFSIERISFDNEYIRDFQRTRLGRLQGNHALLELLPLPNPSVDPTHWDYHNHSQLPYLIDRKSYESRLIPHRIAGLRKQIQQYRPRVVVFYGANWIYKAWWQRVIDVRYTETDPAFGMSDRTLFVIMKHPTAHGVPNTYFEDVGHKIRTLLANFP